MLNYFKAVVYGEEEPNAYVNRGARILKQRFFFFENDDFTQIDAWARAYDWAVENNAILSAYAPPVVHIPNLRLVGVPAKLICSVDEEN